MHLSVMRGNDEKWSYDYNIFEIPQTLAANYLVDKSWDTDLPHLSDYRIKAAGNMITCVDSMRFWVLYYADPDDFIAAHPISVGGGLRIKEIKSYDTNGSFSFGKQYTDTPTMAQCRNTQLPDD